MGRYRLQRRGRSLPPDQIPLRLALKMRAVAVDTPQPEFGKPCRYDQLPARIRVVFVQDQPQGLRLKFDQGTPFRADQSPSGARGKRRLRTGLGKTQPLSCCRDERAALAVAGRKLRAARSGLAPVAPALAAICLLYLRPVQATFIKKAAHRVMAGAERPRRNRHACPVKAEAAQLKDFPAM